MRNFSIIVAVDSKMGIGKNNTLPWRLPKEMKHFTQTTSRVNKEGCRNAVIMGRKSWDAIPLKYRPLPNRLNVILSRTMSDAPEGCLLFRSLGEALTHFAEPSVSSEIEKVFVIGGGALYAEALQSEQCERVYLTRLNQSFDCDVSLLAEEKWMHHFVESSDPNVDGSPQEDKGVGYAIHVYDRKSS